MEYLVAARNGDWKTMRSYLDIDENVKYSVDETSKKTAAVLVIENNHIELLRAMLNRGVAVSSPLVGQSDSIIFLANLATRLGNIDAIQTLANVDYQLFDIWRDDNILVLAVRHNQRNLVEWLLDVPRMDGQNLLLVAVDSGHLPLAKWMMSTGRAGIDDFTAVMRAASLSNWKILSGLLEICDPDFTSVDFNGNTFWDMVDWRALVTIHADNVDAIGFMTTLRQKKEIVFPEKVNRLMRNANIYTSENYLRAAKEGDWSHMSTCLDEYFPLSESIDTNGKSAAMVMIDSGMHLILLTRLDTRGALFHPHYETASRNSTLKRLGIYAADTMNIDSLEVLISLGGDKLVENLARHTADNGGLQIMKWLMKNYERILLHGVLVWTWGENVLTVAIIGDQLDIVEWLMDTMKMTTCKKSPLHYAINYGEHISFTARWLLKTGRSSSTDIQTEFKYTIGKKWWTEASFLIEVGKADIDEDFLWQNVHWLKLAKDTSKDAKLFLRTLLPRIDFPSHVYNLLMNTSSRRRDGKKIFIHRLMVRKGIVVRERVKTLHESRTRIVKKLDLPDDVKKYYLLDSFLSDKQMGMTTNKMWTSIESI